MTTETLPFQELFELGTLSRGGADVRIAADEKTRARIAQWADVQAVDSFTAAISLRKHSASTFSLDADMVADLVQDCVVTLEPVKSHIERTVHRELHLTQHRHRGDSTIALSQDAGADDMPEEIDSLQYDLAGPLLEELALAIDPYPRAPGVEFAAPSEEPEAGPKPESPFAVLKSLKNRE